MLIIAAPNSTNHEAVPVAEYGCVDVYIEINKRCNKIQWKLVSNGRNNGIRDIFLNLGSAVCRFISH